MKDDQKEKDATFTLVIDMKGKPHKQQLKKVCKSNTYKAFNKNQSDQEERTYLDNGSDTFGIEGDAWITKIITDQKFDIAGYNEEDTKNTDVPVGSAVTAFDLPDGETIIICANETTLLGESSNSLFYEAQMSENGVHIQQKMMDENIWTLKDISYLLLLRKL